MYLYGDVGEFDISSAARLFLHSVINVGDVVGQKVATLHMARPAVPMSEGEGLKEWMTRGPAGSSDEECLFRAGIMFLDGVAVNRDPKTAILFLRIAAGRGHVLAMLALGRVLLNPDNGEPSPKEAVAYLLRASHAGNVEAMVAAGGALRSGKHGPHDPQMGIYWLKKAAELGDPEGLFEMGLVFADQGKDVLAAEYFQQALDQGLAGVLGAGCALRLSMIYRANGQRLRAIEILERGLISKRDGHLAVLDNPQLRDFLLADLDDLWLRQAISLADDDADEYDEAIAYLESKRAWLPISGTHCPLMLANLGVLYHNDGQKSKAIEIWREAIAAHVPVERRPGDSEWENYQTSLAQVRAYLAQCLE
jgi:TPR repeat protein